MERQVGIRKSYSLFCESSLCFKNIQHSTYPCPPRCMRWVGAGAGAGLGRGRSRDPRPASCRSLRSGRGGTRPSPGSSRAPTGTGCRGWGRAAAGCSWGPQSRARLGRGHVNTSASNEGYPKVRNHGDGPY